MLDVGRKKINPYSNSSSIDISSQTVRDMIVWMVDGDGRAVSVRWQPPAHCSVPAFRIVAKQIVVGPAKVAAVPLGGITYCLFWLASNDSFPLPATAKHWLEISWRFPQREKKGIGSADSSRKTSAISTRCYNYLTTEPQAFR